MKGAETEVVNWGTWEELLLGGAVLRHGTRDWDAVAAELRTRTLYPFSFTAEVCKAKYEELQKHFRGKTNKLFEELRKHRVDELKRELEKSDNSIGSLQSKLESLQAEKKQDPNVKYDSAQTTASPTSVANSLGVDFSGKDTSKDGLSAGSFTEEARPGWSPDCQPLAEVPAQPTETKPNQIENTMLVGFGTLKKRRGKRKRKDCIVVIKEEAGTKEESTGDCGRVIASVDAIDQIGQTVVEEPVDLMKILKAIIENEHASVFLKRLESQKKAKYKKAIRRHMDFGTVRWRISSRAIKSIRELYRDLLVLCNNAMVFFPTDSKEYKSAQLLRDMFVKRFRHNLPVFIENASEKPKPKRSAKPRSACTNKREVKENVVPEETAVGENEKRACDGEKPSVKPRSTCAKKETVTENVVPEETAVRESEKRACDDEKPSVKPSTCTKKRKAKENVVPEETVVDGSEKKACDDEKPSVKRRSACTKKRKVTETVVPENKLKVTENVMAENEQKVTKDVPEEIVLGKSEKRACDVERPSVKPRNAFTKKRKVTENVVPDNKRKVTENAVPENKQKVTENVVPENKRKVMGNVVPENKLKVTNVMPEEPLVGVRVKREWDNEVRAPVKKEFDNEVRAPVKIEYDDEVRAELKPTAAVEKKKGQSRRAGNAERSGGWKQQETSTPAKGRSRARKR